MARLYDINQESPPGEITNSLAQSLKKGLFTPTEKKFSALETEMVALMQIIELEAGKLSVDANEKFYRLENEFLRVRKWLRVSTSLSLASLTGIIIAVFFLFKWSS